MQRMRIPVVVLLLLGSTATTARAFQAEQYEFSGITRITGECAFGDVILKPTDGRNVRIELVEDVAPAGVFRGEVEQHGSTVNIREVWGDHRSRVRLRSRIRLRWTIYLPTGGNQVLLSWNTASGDIEAEWVSVNLRYETATGDVDLTGVTLAEGSTFTTASGDITLRDMTLSAGQDFDTANTNPELDDFNVTVDDKVIIGAGYGFFTASGDIELTNVTIPTTCRFSTASGDVRAIGCRGAFDLNTAGGNVLLLDCELTAPGEFATAAGDMYIRIEHLPAHDLVFSSSAGDVEFEADDFGRNYTLVMETCKDRGRISCPMDYTMEEEFERNGRTYLRKIVQVGSGGPEIRLSAASERIIVRR